LPTSIFTQQEYAGVGVLVFVYQQCSEYGTAIFPDIPDAREQGYLAPRNQIVRISNRVVSLERGVLSSAVDAGSVFSAGRLAWARALPRHDQGLLLPELEICALKCLRVPRRRRSHGASSRNQRLGVLLGRKIEKPRLVAQNADVLADDVQAQVGGRVDTVQSTVRSALDQQAERRSFMLPCGLVGKGPRRRNVLRLMSAFAHQIAIFGE